LGFEFLGAAALLLPGNVVGNGSVTNGQGRDVENSGTVTDGGGGGGGVGGEWWRCGEWWQSDDGQGKEGPGERKEGLVGGGMEQARRSKRQRVAVDYARLDTSGFADCMRVQHKKLTRAVLKFSNEVQAQDDTNSLSVSFLQPRELAPHVHSSGFANPCVVRASPQSRTVLGIRSYSLSPST
jgi:hypothetical protein